MRAKDVYALKKGDKIVHKHYGVCTVTGIIPEFGPTISPDTRDGLVLLYHQTQTCEMFKDYPFWTPLLETSFRLILSKVEKLDSLDHVDDLKK